VIEVETTVCAEGRIGFRSVHDLRADLAAFGSGCGTSTGDVEAVLDKIEWIDEADRRLLVIGDEDFRAPDALAPGRRTIEELMHRAERDRVTIHVWGLAEASSHRRPKLLERVVTDLDRFVSRPTAPNGRVPAYARHGTIMGGGSFQVILHHEPGADGFPCRAFNDQKTCEELQHKSYANMVDPELLKKLRGRVQSGPDVLDALASGAKRPSEVDPADLPEFLQGLDLEPLQDPIFDFVDARAVLESLVPRFERLANRRALDSQGVGVELAHRVLSPPRWPPSRR
jgi:hypothetical protein